MPRNTRTSQATPNGLSEDATVDAHDEGEQALGFFSVLEDELKLPFAVKILGMEAQVKTLRLSNDNRIVAICQRAKDKQPICLTDLPDPLSRPEGWEWVEAYRHWRSCF